MSDKLNKTREYARKMALDVNGAKWVELSEAQRRGWFLKAAWAQEFLGSEPMLFQLAKEYLNDV